MGCGMEAAFSRGRWISGIVPENGGIMAHLYDCQCDFPLGVASN